MSARRHRHEGPRAVPCAVLTVSDTRRPDTDRSGAFLARRLTRAGHEVVAAAIEPDEPRAIRARLRRFASQGRARVVLVTGGTGIAPRDRTYEAIAGLLEKRLDGFGELFRALSYRAIGSAAMLSRAVAGTWRGRMVFLMPGAPAAVRLALERLILPELAHVAFLLEASTRRAGRSTRRGERAGTRADAAARTIRTAARAKRSARGGRRAAPVRRR